MSRRIFTRAAYEFAREKDAAEPATREAIGNGVEISFGPVWDEARGGRKWGGMGWRIHRQGQSGFTYVTGRNAEAIARDLAKEMAK